MKRKRLRVAVYVDYIDSEYVLRMYTGIMNYFADKDVEVITFAAGQLEDKGTKFNYQLGAITSHIIPATIDGVIFLAGTQMHRSSPEFVTSFLQSFSPIPVVSVGCVFTSVPSILSDCSSGLYKVVTHLIKEHHRKRIALMGVAGKSTEAAERTRIFRKALEENKIPVDESLFMYGRFTYGTACAELEKKYGNEKEIDFDAIVALNDDMAYACMDFLQGRNIRVPEEVSVTGFDNLARSAMTTPPLTTVNQNIEEQGYTAAEKIYALLNGEKVALVTNVESEAVIRQSCGCKKNEKEIIKLNHSFTNGSTTEWCEKSAQFVQAIHLYSDMQEELTIDEFRKTIEQRLVSVDIQAAAICFFKTPLSTDYFEYFPLPSEALLLAAFDKKNHYEFEVSKEPIEFNPNECMIPKDTLTNLNGMFALSLYRGAVQYGYILFKPGKFDMIVYNMVCKMFSNSLAISYSITCSEQEKKKLETEYSIVNKISLTDEMTGLLNRRGFMALGQKMLEVAEAIPQSGMVLYGDMDGLKKINDTYGHAAGDRAIKAEAVLLRNIFRSSDILGRLGGDEFGIVAASLTKERFDDMQKELVEACAKWNKESGENLYFQSA